MGVLNWLKEHELVVAVATVVALLLGAYQVVQERIDRVDDRLMGEDDRLAGEIKSLETRLGEANGKIQELEKDWIRSGAALKEVQVFFWDEFRETCQVRGGTLVPKFKTCEFPKNPDREPMKFRLLGSGDPFSDSSDKDSE